MHRRDRGCGERFHHEVAVGHRVERIRGRAVEAERLRGHRAVEPEGGAGERRRAQRAFIQALARIGEAAAIARRHLHIRQQMMPERHRLRGLQMREARHDGCGMRQRLFGERALIAGQRRVDVVDRVAHPKLEVGRDLVVARARRMQTPGRRPDQLREPRLDVHMDVFERPLEAELARLHLGQDGIQAVGDGPGVVA